MNDSVRYHGLDALRAFAMIMGVVLHASMFYVEGIGTELGYELTGRLLIPTSETLGLLFFFIHSWRMPVFFLLAGFFARLMVQRRSTINLLKNRFIRILVPLTMGVLAYSLIFQFGSLRELHHLWFLYDLIWMYCLLVCIKFASKLWPRIPAKLDWFFGSTTKLWWLMILLLPTTTIGRPGFFNWIHTELGIPGPFFVLGFTYFLIGWFLHRNTHILAELAARWRTYLILGIISFGALVGTTGLAVSENLNKEAAGLLWLCGIIIGPLTTLLMIMGFIGGSHSIFQSGNKVIAYFVDASYWIYLLHLVVVFTIGAEILIRTSLQPIAATLLNIIATTFICVATYHIFVRYTPLGWILNGKKRRSANSPELSI